MKKYNSFMQLGDFIQMVGAKRRQIIAFLLTLCIVFAMLPIGSISVHADTLPATETANFRTNPTGALALLGSGASWDQTKKELTLENVSFRTTADIGIELPNSSTIILKGTNTIEATAAAAKTCVIQVVNTLGQFGLNSGEYVGGNLYFCGDGELTINYNNMYSFGIRTYSTIYFQEDSKVTINETQTREFGTYPLYTYTGGQWLYDRAELYVHGIRYAANTITMISNEATFEASCNNNAVQGYSQVGEYQPAALASTNQNGSGAISIPDITLVSNLGSYKYLRIDPMPKLQISDISAPSTLTNTKMTLSTPTVTGTPAPTSQGWQYRDRSDIYKWTTFDPSTMIFTYWYYNGINIRYFAKNQVGTSYSNTVQATITRNPTTLEIRTEPASATSEDDIWVYATLTGVKLTSYIGISFYKNDVYLGFSKLYTFNNTSTQGTAMFNLGKLAVGDYEIKAEFSGTSDAEANAPSDSTLSCTVLRPKANQSSVSFASTATIYKTYGDTSFTLPGVSGGSGTGAYSYRSGNEAVATVSGNVVTIHGAGSTYVYVKKLGDADYKDSNEAYVRVSVAKIPLTISGVTTNSKIYDGNATAPMDTSAAVLQGVILDGDDVQLDLTTARASFANKYAMDDKTVTFSDFALSGAQASNYALAQPISAKANISRKQLTINEGINAEDKIYDGNDTATLVMPLFTTEMGFVTGDNLTADAQGQFRSIDVDSNITVDISGITLRGTDSGNYVLTATGNQSTTTAGITPKTITVTPNTLSKTVGQDDPVLSYTFSKPVTGETASLIGTLSRTAGETAGIYPINIGTLALVDNGSFKITNYELELSATTVNFTINKANQSAISFDSTSTINKTYGDPTFTLPAISGGSGTGDYSYRSDNETVATVSGNVVTIHGAGEAKIYVKKLGDANYKDSAEASITIKVAKLSLNISGVTTNNKTYDGNTTAPMDASGAVLHGVINSDDVHIDATNARASFASKSAGNGKIVTFAGFALSGAKSANYILAQPASATADIAPKIVTINGISAEDKIYDGSRTAILVMPTITTAMGIVTGDNLTAHASGLFADKDVDTNITVDITGITLGGADAGNYVLAATGHQSTTTAGITPKIIIVTPATLSKNLGQESPALSYTHSETAPGETAGFTGALSRTAGETVGSYPISIGDLALADNGTFKIANYELELSATTVNFSIAAVVATTSDYAVSGIEDAWNNTDLTITPSGNYTQISTDGMTWSNSLTLSTEGSESTVNFYLKKADGTTTERTAYTYKLDKTAPTGTLTIQANSWTQFLNTITFGLFFKENVDVSFTSDADLSGIAKTEFIKTATIYNETGIKTATGWADFNNTTISAVDNENFIYYIRLTDRAGNVSYINSQGMLFDKTAPVIGGITDGETYYTTIGITATDPNIDTITINNEPFSGSTIAGDIEETYTIVVTDKAGNSTTYTITMKTIASISTAIDSLTTDNVKSSDKDSIEAIQTVVTAIDLAHATQAEKDKLTAISDKCEALLAKISTIADEIAAVTTRLGGTTKDNATSGDSARLAEVKAELERLLATPNLTAAERTSLGSLLATTTAAIAEVAKVEGEIAAVTTRLGGTTKDNATSGDSARLAEVKAELERLLATPNLTAAERTNLGSLLATTTAAIAEVAKVEGEIAAVTTKLGGTTKDNATSGDSARLAEVKAELERLLATPNLTAAERTSLDSMLATTTAAIAVVDNELGGITEIEKVIKDAQNLIINITKDNVQKADRVKLEKADKDLQNVLDVYTDNLIDTEKAKIEAMLQSTRNILKVLDEVKAVEDLIDALPNPDDVKLTDADDIIKVENGFNQLSGHQQDLTDRDKVTKLEEVSIALRKLLLFDAPTGTKVEGVDGTSFDISTELVVTPIKDTLDETTMNKFALNIANAAEGQEIAQLYDIKLLLDGQPIQPDGKVKITLKLTNEQQNYKDLQVVYIADDGTVTIIPCEINGDELTFITDHLSYYGIIGTPVKTNSCIYIIFLLILILLVLMLIRKMIKRKSSNPHTAS